MSDPVEWEIKAKLGFTNKVCSNDCLFRDHVTIKVVAKSDYVKAQAEIERLKAQRDLAVEELNCLPYADEHVGCDWDDPDSMQRVCTCGHKSIAETLDKIKEM